MVGQDYDGPLGKIKGHWMFAEAAAIPSHPRKGRILTPGLASESSNANRAIESALVYVRTNQKRFEDLFGGKPYIDIERLIRLDLNDGEHRGEPVSSNADVDVILHIPPHINATFMAPAMVIALVMMQWRFEWAPVKWFDDDGTLYGYPILDDEYVTTSKRWGFKHLLLPKYNAEQVQEVATRVGGIEVVGCDSMFEMVQAGKEGGGFTMGPEV